MKVKAKKGCVNPDCEMCSKKKHAHKSDLFCPKCGHKLAFVCEKCHTFLENSDKKLCIWCEGEKDDAKEKGKGIVGKAGAFVAGIFTVVSAGVAAVNNVRNK